MEHWNYDNFTDSSKEEFQYANYISNIEDKIYEVKGMLNKLHMQVYDDITNNKPKIKQTEKLDKIDKLLNEIMNILKEGE